jgi:hypothetical protein
MIVTTLIQRVVGQGSCRSGGLGMVIDELRRKSSCHEAIC